LDDTKPAALISPEEEKEQSDDTITLTFEDYLDVQTRLVLLPSNEHEAQGAVISSFSSSSTTEKEEHRDDGEGSHPKLPQEEYKNYNGYILTGIQNHQQESSSFPTMDFATILATIRQATNTPITLQFTKLNIPPQTNNNTAQQLQSSFLSWGQRMRAQAAEAADRAADKMADRMERLTKERRNSQKTAQPQQNVCDIFLQTSVGAYIPVSSFKESKVSSSSLLFVRKSATQVLPVQKYNFQWYRSSSSSPQTTNEEASIDSSTSGRSYDTGNSMEWIPLEGATLGVFQPDTTLMGHKLRCRITPKLSEEGDLSSDESFSSDNDSARPSFPLILQVSRPVIADPTVFNGARQALLRNAKMSFQGRGNASKHSFSVHVAIGVGPQGRRKQVPMSSISIQLTTTEENIGLTETPILQVLAQTDYSNSKYFTLLIPNPEKCSMLAAMCSDSGKLELEASNRMARESFLMALGIANYQGNPANLGCTTLLYPDYVPKSTTISLMDEVSVSSASSFDSSRLMSSPEKSIASLTDDDDSNDASSQVTSVLQQELKLLQAKLARKDKVVSQLQQQIVKSNSAYQQTRQALSNSQSELKQSKKEIHEKHLLLSEKDDYIQTQRMKTAQAKQEHASNVSFLNKTVSKQSQKITELEKSNKILQNEKAVLAAAVEARESKLIKMSDLQSSMETLQEKLQRQEKIQTELKISQQSCQSLKEELERSQQQDHQNQKRLQDSQTQIADSQQQLQQSKKLVHNLKKELDPLQTQNQKLKSERNHFKQRNDGISKEMAKLLQDGRTIPQIHQQLENYQALSEELIFAKKQKRKALEEAHAYRNSSEQAKTALLASCDNDSTEVQVFQRNAELEYLLKEMTEYVNAKEMQFNTMKQVNEHLQHEIHSLAQANLRKNEV
jgi:hypothetical protein